MKSTCNQDHARELNGLLGSVVPLQIRAEAPPRKRIVVGLSGAVRRGRVADKVEAADAAVALVDGGEDEIVRGQPYSRRAFGRFFVVLVVKIHGAELVALEAESGVEGLVRLGRVDTKVVGREDSSAGTAWDEVVQGMAVGVGHKAVGGSSLIAAEWKSRAHVTDHPLHQLAASGAVVEAHAMDQSRELVRLDALLHDPRVLAHGPLVEGQLVLHAR